MKKKVLNISNLNIPGNFRSEMATPMSGTFDVWLTEKLTSVSPDIDTDVFVGYIIGILDEDVDEDTEESIVELLSGVLVSFINRTGL